MKASKAVEILAELQYILFYNETTFAQFQNIRGHVRGTGNVLSALLHKSATVNLTGKTQVSKLRCIDRSKPQTLTVKLYIHNLSTIKLQLLRFIHWLLLSRQCGRLACVIVLTQRFRVLQGIFEQTYERVSNTCSEWAGRSTCGCVYVWFCSFFFILPPPGCSCDDVGSSAPRSLVDPRDLEGDGNKRTQHNLEKRAVTEVKH